MKDMAPGAYMTAPIWNWGPYYAEQVKNVLDGNFKAHAYWGGLESGTIELAPLTDLAPEGAQALVDQAKDGIISGDLFVFEGPIKGQDGEIMVAEGQEMTDEEMLNMMWFVEGVIGNAK